MTSWRFGSVVALVVWLGLWLRTARAETSAELGVSTDPGTFVRDGFSLGLGAGPVMFVGTPGVTSSAGVGSGFSMRVGTSATPRMQWILELTVGGFLVSFANTDETSFNAQATLTLGVQYWFRDALWARFGLGFANFVQRDERGGVAIEDTRRDGIAAVAGIGADLYRRGIFVLDLGSALTAIRFDGDVSATLALYLAANWY